MSDLIATAKDKTEVIVTFLALLELIQAAYLNSRTRTNFSEIIIKKTENQD